MRKRFRWLLGALISLGVGAVLYGVYRQDTHIGGILRLVFRKEMPIDQPLAAFAAWYFPDYLWMFSLSCCLFAILSPEGESPVISSVIALSSGVIWELFQLFGVVPGTADLWDIFLYIMAVLSTVMITVFTKKEKKK